MSTGVFFLLSANSVLLFKAQIDPLCPDPLNFFFKK